jgi:pyruvate/2-oxoglutarate dehydrogenase complex dihydrolipoamide dehydrogenase (E3) component
MKKDGVEFLFDTAPVKFEKVEGEGDAVKVIIENKKTKEQRTEQVDIVMICTGRVPNVEGLGCEAAGVQYDRFGIKVN